MYLVINKCVTAVKVSNFSGHYLRNSSTLDIGVLGYIGIVQHKEHSPEVLSIPPGTLCILEVTCFIQKYCQSLELNSNVHKYNTRRKMYIHIQSYKTDIYKKGVINMGTKVYNKLRGYIKEINSYKAFKKEMKLFLLLHTFYSVEKFVTM